MKHNDICAFCGSKVAGTLTAADSRSLVTAVECELCGIYLIPGELRHDYRALSDHPRRFHVMAHVESEWRRTGEPVLIRAEWFEALHPRT